MNTRKLELAGKLGLILTGILAVPFLIHAGPVDDLQSKISERNSQINQLEAEIARYQDQLDSIGKEKQSLQSAINSLTVSQKKLEAELGVTQNKIAAANLKLDELTLGISDQSEKLQENINAIAQATRTLDATETDSLIEVILKYKSVSEFWNILDSLKQLRISIKENSDKVRAIKAGLENTKTEVEKQKRELVALKSRQADQKQIIAQNKKQQTALLSETKNKESNYQKQLSDKVALKAAFEQEVSEYEAQLKFELDPSTLPKTGSGVLAWPLDKVTITQYFGKTAFAQSGAYNGQGHNGIDFRASVGTPIKAALAGTVRGTGNTDLVCRGASYGQWALVDHGNGLSTLYAHFSLTKVSSGQTVETGQIIGYSGQSGYATGPHLHLTVFATKAVEITKLKSKVCSGTYTIPVSSLSGYLNPIDYF